MSAAENIDFSLQSELDRKVADALQQLRLRYDTGQITESQLSESMRTLYRACFGLVEDTLLQEVLDDYKPTVEIRSCYYVRMYKLTESIDVTWYVDDEFIGLRDSYTGDQRQLLIPEKSIPHDHFRKMLDALEKKGWRYEP